MASSRWSTPTAPATCDDPDGCCARAAFEVSSSGRGRPLYACTEHLGSVLASEAIGGTEPVTLVTRSL